MKARKKIPAFAFFYGQVVLFLLTAYLYSASTFMTSTLGARSAFADEFSHVSAVSLKTMESDGKEIAIIDPREEGVFGEAHLLLAVNIPLSKFEIEIGTLVPRKSTRLVLTDGGDGQAERAAAKLKELGYNSVAILDGGVPAWRAAGYEAFSGMSVPTKGFGEWIAVTYGTPTITPEELHQKLAAGKDVLILDSRPANEYANMNIPGSINVPVSELVYRFPELQVKPDTLVVVNCAGRTRSLIGAQTLINAGVKNVVALRGGTPAWQMAGFYLEHGSTRHAPEPWGKNLKQALETAQKVADRYQVRMIDAKTLESYKAENGRTVYIIDVRTPDEFRAGHRPDSIYAWGVQLVQSTDKYVASRNARLVLVDDHMVRALMTASWLVQAGWPDAVVLADPFSGVQLETGDRRAVVPGLNEIRLPRIEPEKLNELIQAKKVTVIDFADSISYKIGHIPGAWFAIRSRLAESINKFPGSLDFVATGDNAALVALAARDLAELSGKPVSILSGGNAAWRKAKFPLSKGFENLSTKTDDVFRMPFLWGHFDDKEEFEKAAIAYKIWELQLPAQLERAGELKFVGAPK
ncbi:MAG: rhodanese-like domain-containing protein [Dissulfurispiraceae bacterium]